jgi:hypothetical protein
MVKVTIRYERYAVSALASVGFGIQLNWRRRLATASGAATCAAHDSPRPDPACARARTSSIARPRIALVGRAAIALCGRLSGPSGYGVRATWLGPGVRSGSA